MATARCGGWAALTMVAALVVPMLAGAGGSAAGHVAGKHVAGKLGQAQEIGPRPLSVVVLVDESGSLPEAGVAAERDAATLIAQSELSTESQVAVIGFGGNTGLPGQTPVQVRCQPTTVATGQDRDYLARCVQDIHKRTEAEGHGTNYPKALAQALQIFAAAPDGYRKVLFLLTDGQLDVSGDPAYGQQVSDAVRNEAALREMHEYLQQASSAGVQVWPLGFGRALPAQLDDFAARGSQALCGPGSPTPRARVVTDPGQVVDSLTEAFAAARCGGVNRSETKVLRPGTTVELTIEVPPIATNGAISVIKRDPRIRVEYRDPDGALVPKSGTHGDSTFQISGEGSAIEVLRITEPLPGRWQVRLVSPNGVAQQDVAATVLWQGAVRARVSLLPPSPRAGQVAIAQIVLETRRGVVADPEVLRGLTVVATLTGEGFEPVPVQLRDDGSGGDDRADDGSFNSQVTVPSTATGAYRLVAAVGGAGIESTDQPADGRVDTGEAMVRAQVRLDQKRVAPGGRLGGTIEVTNDSGVARKARLQLTGLDEGTLATVSPAVVDIPASGSSAPTFEISFAAGTEIGSRAARLLVVDDEQPSTRYADLTLVFDVGYPPPWWSRHRYPLAALGVVLLAALAAGLVRVLRRRADRDVRGLVLLLFRDEQELGFLAAPEQPSSQFWFVIRDADVGQPRLDNIEPYGGYLAARGVGSSVTVRTPTGQKLRVRPGVPEPVTGDLALAFRDERDSAEHGRRRRFDRPGPDTPAEQPVAAPAAAAAGPPSTYDDLL